MDKFELARYFDSIKHDVAKRNAFLTEYKERTPVVPDAELNFPLELVETAAARKLMRQVETFAPRNFGPLRYTSTVIKEKTTAEKWLHQYNRIYMPFSKKFMRLINRIREEDMKDKVSGVFPRKHLIYVEEPEVVPYLAAALESNDFMKMRIHVEGSDGRPKKILGLKKSPYGSRSLEAINIRKETFVAMTSSLGHTAEPSKERSDKKGGEGKETPMNNIFTFRENMTGFYSTTPSQMKTLNPQVAGIFNSRGETGGHPDNTNGQVCRFLIIDQNNTEGLDVYDIGHFWILQPPVEYNKLLQIIGRVTRSCGNKGLAKKLNLTKSPTNPNKYDPAGWVVNVYLMASAIKVQGIPGATPLYIQYLATDMEALRNINLAEEMETEVEKCAIDAQLYAPLQGTSGNSVVDQTKITKSLFYTHSAIQERLDIFEQLIPRTQME